MLLSVILPLKLRIVLSDPFFWCFLYLRRLRLYLLSSDETETSLKDGSDKSSFRCLRRFFFFMYFFYLALESDENDSDESNDEESGSRFTSSSCFFLRIDSFDRLV